MTKPSPTGLNWFYQTSFIHENQSRISDGFTAIRDAIYLCETTNTPAAVISLDQMKAFDRISWDYMTAVPTKFGFGPDFPELGEGFVL